MRLFKSLSIFIVLFSLCLSLVGCGFLFKSPIKTDFQFLHETSEIKAIEIVIIGEIERIEDTSSESSAVVYNPNFDVVCCVEDIEQFMDDFSKVECFMASPPSSPRLDDIGIKIIYNNDEYEIICSIGQAEYRNGVYYFDAGKNSFDDTQFDTLINKYTNDINKKD